MITAMGLLIALSGVVSIVEPASSDGDDAVVFSDTNAQGSYETSTPIATADDFAAGAPATSGVEHPGGPTLLADSATVTLSTDHLVQPRPDVGTGSLDPDQLHAVQKIGKRAKKLQQDRLTAENKLALAQAKYEAAQFALMSANEMPESNEAEVAAKAKALKAADKLVAKTLAKVGSRQAKVDKLHASLSGLHALIADVDATFFTTASSDVPSLAVINLEEQDLLFYWTPVTNASAYTLTWAQEADVTPGDGTTVPVEGDLWVLTGMPDEIEIFAVVTATVADVESLPSNEVSAITGPLTPSQLAKLDRLQKQLDQKIAKQEQLEGYLAAAEALLAEGQDELAAAQELPESTPEELAAKLAAISAAQTKIAKAEKAVTKWTNRLDAIAGTIAALEDKLEEIDPDYFGNVTFVPAPEIVAAIGGQGFVYFDWTDVENAELYRVYVSTQSGVTPETGSLFQTATSVFALQDLPSDFEIHAVVTALVEGEETPPSDEASAATDAPTDPEPILALDTLSISFVAVEGGADPAPRDVTIANEGGGSMSWTASANAAWIDATPDAGSLGASESEVVSVAVDISGLSAGTYTKTLTFASDEASNPPESVMVMLVVSEPPPAFGVGPGSLSFSATQGGSDPSSQSLTITNTGGGTLAWTAGDNAAWLSVSPSSGNLAAGVSKVVTVSASTSAASVGSNSATISFSAPSANSTSVPVSFAVQQSSASSITAAITPSRTSGVAPLSVFFDASDTSAVGVSRPFHELEYAWEFSDPGSGTWATTGNLRTEARGPVAGHVFEEAGSYTVTLTVRDDSGDVDTEQVVITVDDPDVFYAGTNTICVSRSGNFAGAPAGSQHVTTTNLGTAMGYVATGKRLLFRRGESWTGGGNSINTAGPITIGAYGTGAKPAFNVSSNFLRLSDKFPVTNDWRIMDLDISGSGATGIQAEGTVKQLLVLRVDLHDLDNGMVAALSVLNYYNNSGFPMEIFEDIAIVDSSSVDQNTYGVFVASKRFMFMGNDFGAVVNEHLLRTVYVGAGVISNNTMQDGSLAKHLLKVQAPPYGASGLGYHLYTEKVSISDNIFDCGASQWGVVPGPENSVEDERLRNIILERNMFVASGTSIILLRASGDDVTIRHNIFDLTGAAGTAAVWVSKRGADPAPNRAYVVNNTFYRGDSGGFEAIRIASDAIGAVVKNNLGSAPFANPKDLVVNDAGSSTTEVPNLLTDTPGFVSSDPQTAADFHITSTSEAVDEGVTVSASLGDFESAGVAVDGDGNGSAEPDMGAFEYKP